MVLFSFLLSVCRSARPLAHLEAKTLQVDSYAGKEELYNFIIVISFLRESVIPQGY